MEKLKLFYLAVATGFVSILWKINYILENTEQEAILMQNKLKLFMVVMIYGLFGAMVGVSSYLIFHVYFEQAWNIKLEYLGYALSGLSGTLGTTGIKLWHRYLEKKAS